MSVWWIYQHFVKKISFIILNKKGNGIIFVAFIFQFWNSEIFFSKLK